MCVSGSAPEYDGTIHDGRCPYGGTMHVLFVVHLPASFVLLLLLDNVVCVIYVAFFSNDIVLSVAY